MVENTITNKVAESGLITFDIEEYCTREEIIALDIKDFLYQGLIIREKDFRNALNEVNWESYTNKNVTIFCSTDAIIPMWVYMLLASYLEPFTKEIFYGDISDTENQLLLRNLSTVDWNSFLDKRVVVKGCGEKNIHPSAYLHVTTKLRPFAKSIMYGEPCSTVPIFKKR